MLLLLFTPFVFNETLFLGFFNYSMGIPLLLFFYGFLLKNADSPTDIRYYLSATGLSFLCYFSHPLCFGLALVFFLQLYLLPLVYRQRPDWRRFLLQATVFLPGILLLLLFAAGSTSPGQYYTSTIGERIKELHTSGALSVFSEHEVLAGRLFFAFALLCLAPVIYRRATRGSAPRRGDLLALNFCTLLVFYLFGPSQTAGASMVSERLLILVFIFFFLWLATQPFAFKKSLFVIVPLFTLGFIALRHRALVQSSSMVTEILSMTPYIAENATVIPLSYDHHGKDTSGEKISTQNWFFVHAADYLGTEKDLVLLGNYEANTGYFPLNWKPACNPFVYLDHGRGIEGTPPQIDIEHYEKKSSRTVDYVMLLFPPEGAGSDGIQPLKGQDLEDDFDFVANSVSGRVMLFKRKG